MCLWTFDCLADCCSTPGLRLNTAIIKYLGSDSQFESVKSDLPFVFEPVLSGPVLLPATLFYVL